MWEKSGAALAPRRTEGCGDTALQTAEWILRGRQQDAGPPEGWGQGQPWGLQGWRRHLPGGGGAIQEVHVTNGYVTVERRSRGRGLQYAHPPPPPPPRWLARADTRAAKEVTRNAEPVGTEVLETVAKCLNTQMLQS